MKHERSDYNDRVKCVDGSIPEDEPVFLLRGKDPVASQVVKYWVFLKDKELSDEKRDAVLAHAEKMWEYKLDFSDIVCTS